MNPGDELAAVVVLADVQRLDFFADDCAAALRPGLRSLAKEQLISAAPTDAFGPDD